jgi:hypothetical protein
MFPQGYWLRRQKISYKSDSCVAFRTEGGYVGVSLSSWFHNSATKRGHALAHAGQGAPNTRKLRQQAEKAWRLARQIIDETASTRLIGLAEEYLSQAEEFERSDKR